MQIKREEQTDAFITVHLIPPHLVPFASPVLAVLAQPAVDIYEAKTLANVPTQRT